MKRGSVYCCVAILALAFVSTLPAQGAHQILPPVPSPVPTHSPQPAHASVIGSSISSKPVSPSANSVLAQNCPNYGGSFSVTTGSDFSFVFYVPPPSDFINSFYVYGEYDPTFLQINYISQGDVPNITNFSPSYNNSFGDFEISGDVIPPAGTTDTNQTLITINFHAVAPTSGTTLTIPNYEVNYASGSVSCQDSKTIIIVPADTVPPTLSWVSPVSHEGDTYTADSGIANLELSASDSSGIDHVHFSRWDAVNGRTVDVSTVYSSPYRATVDIATLNMEWNEIDAEVFDFYGNRASTYFWIYRTPLSANCTTSASFWQNFGLAPQNGTFSVEFTTIPGASTMDGVTGFAAKNAAAYTDLAAIVRFNAQGTIDAMNGTSYHADTALGYSTGLSYHVRMVIRIPNHTYDVFVTPASTGQEIALASNYAFRNTQNAVTNLITWSLYAKTASHQVCDLTITQQNPLPPTAQFTANKVTGLAPLTVQFTDISTGNPTSWAWDFDSDGTIDSTAKNPSHIYATAGTYSVKLTVNGLGGGDSLLKPNYITVSNTTYTVSGSVLDTLEKGIAGVTIADGAGHSTVTGTDGSYKLSGIAAGTYSIRPSKGGYTFSPSSRTVVVAGNTNNITFHGYNKLPVVFVHGWNGLNNSCDWPDPKSYFAKVDDAIHAAGYYVGYASLQSSSCYTPPVTENVARLENAIALAKTATHQSKVILIAHSMGGIVARAYIEGPDYENDVSELFTFGTPHIGVPADLLVFFANGLSIGTYCADYQPAVCDFSVTGMLLFNQNHKQRQGVKYHIISGDAPFFSRTGLGMITAPLIAGADDGIVPTLSGTGYAGLVDRWTTDETHGTNLGPRAYFVRDGADSTSYTKCLKKVLVDGGTTCGSSSTWNTVKLDASVPELSERTPFAYGTLFPGQVNTRNLQLEGGPTLFAAQWQTGKVGVSLIAPNGTVISPTYALSHPNDVIYTEGDSSATYYLPNAASGSWKLVLQAVSVPSSGSSFTTFAAFDSPIKLTAETDRDDYAPGEHLTITAGISGSPSTAAISATVLRPDGGSDSISFTALGNSQYRANYTVPNAPGYAEIRLVAQGSTTSGAPFERGKDMVFHISAGKGGAYHIAIPMARR